MADIINLAVKVTTDELLQAQKNLKAFNDQLVASTRAISAFESTMVKSTKESSNAAQDLNRSSLTLATTIGNVLGNAITTTARMLVNFARDTVNSLDALNDLSDATGSSIENLSILENVAMRTGAKMADVESALIKVNKALAGPKDSDASQVIRALGLDFDALKKMDPSQAMIEIAKGFDKFSDGATKAAAQIELFNKSGPKFNAYLKDLAENSGKGATTLTEQAKAAEEFNKKIFELQTNVSLLARNILKDLIPALNTMIEKMRTEGFMSGLSSLFDPDVATLRKNIKTYETEIAKGEKALTEGFARARPGFFTWSDDDIKKSIAESKTKLNYARSEVERLTKAPTEKPKEPDKPKLPELVSTKDAKAAAKEAAAHAKEQEGFLTKAKDLYGQQSDSLNKILGIDVERLQIIREYDKILSEKLDPKIRKQVKEQKDFALATHDQVIATKKEIEANEELRKFWKEEDEHFQKRQAQRDAAQIQSTNALRAEIDLNSQLYAKMVQIEQSLLTREEKDKARLALQVQLTDGTATFTEGWAYAFQQFQDHAYTAATAAQDVFATMSSSMARGISEFVTTGKLDFKDFARSVIKSLADIYAQMIATKLIGLILGSTTGTPAPVGGTGMKIPSNFSFGGAREKGGPVEAGTSYLVGEKGPEILRTGVSPGRIYPNNTINRGDTNISIGDIVVQGGQTDAETAQAIRREMLRTMKDVADSRIIEQQRPGGSLRIA